MIRIPRTAMAAFLLATLVLPLVAAPPVSPLALGPVQAESAQASGERDEIRFRVVGLRSDKGKVVCTLFAEDGWLRKPEQSVIATIEDGSALCVLPEPEHGIRGISAFHDEDGDGQLDTGFMRIPKEGTCSSNNAFRKFGPPRFKDARFEYQGGRLELEAEMRYLSKKK